MEVLKMDNKKYYLVQDQKANDNEDMFFVASENLEGQFSGYVVWRTGRKKELEELAERWNLEVKLNN